MTDQQHPITPPPELVEQWHYDALESDPSKTVAECIATQAARWGADMELEACINAILVHPGFENPELFVELLRAARRPKPSSLKEQALKALENADGADYPVVATILTADQHALIRRALEALPD